jgi:hypothetical protein
MTSLGHGKVVGLNASERVVKVQIFDLGKVLELPSDDVVVDQE